MAKTRNCPKCNAVVYGTDTECMSCGTQLEAQARPASSGTPPPPRAAHKTKDDLAKEAATNDLRGWYMVQCTIGCILGVAGGGAAGKEATFAVLLFVAWFLWALFALWMSKSPQWYHRLIVGAATFVAFGIGGAIFHR